MGLSHNKMRTSTFILSFPMSYKVVHRQKNTHGVAIQFWRLCTCLFRIIGYDPFRIRSAKAVEEDGKPNIKVDLRMY